MDRLVELGNRNALCIFQAKKFQKELEKKYNQRINTIIDYLSKNNMHVFGGVIRDLINDDVPKDIDVRINRWSGLRKKIDSISNFVSKYFFGRTYLIYHNKRYLVSEGTNNEYYNLVRRIQSQKSCIHPNIADYGVPVIKLEIIYPENINLLAVKKYISLERMISIDLVVVPYVKANSNYSSCDFDVNTLMLRKKNFSTDLNNRCSSIIGYDYQVDYSPIEMLKNLNDNLLLFLDEDGVKSYQTALMQFNEKRIKLYKKEIKMRIAENKLKAKTTATELVLEHIKKKEFVLLDKYNKPLVENHFFHDNRDMSECICINTNHGKKILERKKKMEERGWRCLNGPCLNPDCILHLQTKNNIL